MPQDGVLTVFKQTLGVKGNTISQYESGRNAPVDSVISLICREFAVNETWLRTGAGEMFQPEPEPENKLESLAREYHLSKRVCALVERFLDLRPEIQEAFVDYTIQVAATLADEPAPADLDPRPRSEKPITEWTEADIDAETEEYRRSLLEEKRWAESGSASSDSSGTV